MTARHQKLYLLNKMNTETPELISFLEDAYSTVGTAQFDYLYLIVDLTVLGRYLPEFANKDDFCQAILSPLLKQGKTLIIPTFTYTSDGQFDCLSTKPRLGALHKWFLSQKECERSEHPLFSVGALGPLASIVLNAGKSAFGRNSIYSRLLEHRSAFLHIGRPVSLGNTAVHYVEQKFDAIYRMHKTFPTRVYRGSTYIGTDYTAFVRRSDVPGHSFITQTHRSAEKLIQAGLNHEISMNDPSTNVSLYSCSEAVELYTKLFANDPNVFIEKPFSESPATF